MVRIWIKYLFMFVFIVLVQVLLLNQIQFSGFINPYFYVIFILLLPVTTPRYALLLISFMLGFVIDLFTNTPGLHIASTVWLGYLRTPVISLISSRESELSDFPRVRNYGLRWFLLYSSLLVVSHHVFLFYIEVFSFTDFLRTLIRVILSSVFTVFVIVLSQYLIFRE
jgi:rod shape-determining protein MreD